MLIVCPACASEYRIAAERVGLNGRSVRCAGCRETWFLSPDEVAAGLESEASEAEDGRDETAQDIFTALKAQESNRTETRADEVSREEPASESAKKRRRARAKPSRTRTRRFGKQAPAIAAGLVLFVLLPLALLGRATVVRAMPQSASLFAAIGLPVNLRGVDLRDVVAFRIAAEGGKPAELVVEGDLVGVARERVEVPPVEVEVRDAQDQPLYRWTIAPPRAALEPAESARFRASLSAPPEKGRHVEVRFAEPKAEDTANQVKPDQAHAETPDAEKPADKPAEAKPPAAESKPPAADAHDAASGGH